LEGATQQLAQSLNQQNGGGMQQTGGLSKVRVNGVPGDSVLFTGQSPITQNGRPVPEEDWLVTLQRSDGSLLYLVFIAPQKDFNALRPTFENMVRSVHLR
jgi:hypothetical protein